MKITCLIENSLAATPTPLKSEHGISLLIEHDGKNVLFDTGASSLFAQNAGVMDIDLSHVDYCVLSHAHFDHTGGLRTFLDANNIAPVVLLSAAGQPAYAKLLFFYKSVGIRPSIFDEYPGRFTYFKTKMELAAGITLLSNTVRKEHRPSSNRMMFVRDNGAWRPDPFDHELIMVIDESDGSVIFTGCSHNGILNMIATVFSQYPGKKIKAVIGGLHLSNPITKKLSEKKDTVNAIATRLKSLPVGTIYTGHCTGTEACQIMKLALGDRLAELKTGMVIRV